MYSYGMCVTYLFDYSWFLFSYFILFLLGWLEWVNVITGNRNRNWNTFLPSGSGFVCKRLICMVM